MILPSDDEEGALSGGSAATTLPGNAYAADFPIEGSNRATPARRKFFPRRTEAGITALQQHHFHLNTRREQTLGSAGSTTGKNSLIGPGIFDEVAPRTYANMARG